jgi:CubicO group peptidase (beta-lactamase class C family)
LTADSAVTLRHLLSHTAGINVSGFTPYPRGEPLPTLADDLLGVPPSRTPALRVEAVPGSSWKYSGGGYQIVQRLIEDATGEPFPALMTRHVLIPLGMEHTRYEQPLDSSVASRVASGHLATGAPVADGWHVVPQLAAGGGWSTASDIAKVVIAIQDAAAGRAGQVVSPASAEMMVTPGRGGYGLGLFVDGHGESLAFNHTGHNTGYRAMLVGHPFTGQGAVVLSNGDSDGGGLVFEVIRGIADVYRWPDYRPLRRTEIRLPHATLDRFAGSYQVEGVGVFRVFRQGDRLSIVAPPLGRDAVRMYAMEPAKFFVTTDSVTFSFTVDSEKTAVSLLIDAPGATFRGRRVTADGRR